MGWKEDYKDDFFARKREMLEFLEAIDYEALNKKVDDAFSEPGCLEAVNNEIGSLEARVLKFREADKISFPPADEEIKTQAKKLEAAAAKFREKAKKDYERAVREFPKEFADTERHKGDMIQTCIRWLRGLSKRYKAAKDVCNLPEQPEIERYFQFTAETEALDSEVKSLIGKYRQAKTRKDIDTVKQTAKKLQREYHEVRQKRKKRFRIHPAFQYENRELNDLEKELGKGMFSARKNIQKDISETVEEAKRIKKGGAPKRRTGFDKDKYKLYERTIFLSELVSQYKTAIDELKKATEDNYDISRKCMQIEDDIKGKKYGELRRADSTAFSHLEPYGHCQKHLERYSALCAHASELVSAYDRDQEVIAQRARGKIRRIELEKAELERRKAEESKKQQGYSPQTPTVPSSLVKDESYSNIFIDLEDLSQPADESLNEFSSSLERFGASWGEKLVGFRTMIKKAKPVNLGKNQDYLQGLRKCLSASIENGTLTTEISLNPSMEKPAKESLAVLDEYIAKCA